MKKNFFLSIFLGLIVSMIIIIFVLIHNYITKNDNKYILYKDEIISITSVIGDRNLKSKKFSTLLNKQNIKKIYTYTDIKDTPSDLSNYVNYLRENDNFLVTKSFDLNNQSGEIELSKYSSIDSNFIIIINISYTKNSYIITLTRAKGTIKIE